MYAVRAVRYFVTPVNTTSAPSAHRRPVFVDCHSRRLGIDRQCTHSLHRNDMAYCHFELCRDCALGCFSELLLADTRRLSVVAVVFLYQITVFYFTTKHNSIAFGTFLMTQCKLCMRAAAAAVAVNKERSLMGPMGRWRRCSIYRHRTFRPKTLSPERHSARMSKITNDGLTQPGIVCFIAVPMWHHWASKG